MVAAISTTSATRNPSPQQQNPINNKNCSNIVRTPLEKDPNGVNQRRPRGRQVSSRYLSPSPSTSSSNSSSNNSSSTAMSSANVKRFASPLVSRAANNLSPFPAAKRSQSVDRRRPGTASTPRPSLSAELKTAEMSAATKMLITSTRSLSVSFQGEAFALPISKTKPAANNNSPAVAATRKATPERSRRVAPVENARPLDQQRWPARARQGNSSSSVNNSLTRSMDISGNDKKKLIGFGSGNIVKALQQSVICDRRLSLDLGNAELLRDDKHCRSDRNLLGNESYGSGDLTSAASDTDSVSSGSTSEVQEGRPRSGPRNIVSSARFWQETNSRLRRLQDPGSPLSSSPGSKIGAPSKFSQSKRFSSEGSVASPRMSASPIRGGTRPASPSKLWTSSSTSSPMRGLSPSRVRSAIAGVLSGNSGNAANSPSILSFSVDVRRGKMGEERIVEAHMLRLLYNRYLQWRFVNARADATFMVQRLNAEKNLWNAWVTISELRHSVTLKRIKLLLLRQKLKLTAILKGQIFYLEEWSLLDRDHSNSLQGATEALKASTLRLPVVGKAVADIQNLKDAVGSAVDVMQAMASSICSLLTKVEEMNAVVAELVNVTEKEKVMLEQCKDFLSMLAAMQVKDCSLRTHIIQLNRVPTTTSLTTRV